MLLALCLPLFLVSVLVCKLYIFYAKKHGWLDHPDNVRKFQRTGVPVGCGCVVALLFLATIGPQKFLFSETHREAYTVILSFFSILYLVCVGFIDDRSPFSGRIKLLLTLIPVFITIGMRFSFFTKPIELLYSCPLQGLFILNIGAVFGTLFMILWLTTFVNTFNLLDGADGFASVYAILFVQTLLIISRYWPQPNPIGAISLLAFTVLLAGFLVFNLPPARAYLGDAGSLPIGFILGLLSFEVFTHSHYVRPLPVLVLAALPILDAVFAIVRRLTLGKSVFEPDLGHLHHVLKARFGGGYRLLIALLVLQLPLSASAICAYLTGYDLIPLLVFSLYCVLLPFLRIFGHREVVLVVETLRNLYRRWFHHELYEAQGAFVQYGNLELRSRWESTLEHVKGLDARSFSLRYDSPTLGCSAFGYWDSGVESGDESSYKTTFENGDSFIISITFDDKRDELELDQLARGFAESFFEGPAETNQMQEESL